MSFLGGSRLAVTTLTVFPLPPSRRAIDRNDAAWAMSFAPVVGLGLGAFVAAAGWGLARAHFAPFPVAAVIVALLALLTRGMHLDGLADTFDGLASYKPADRALEIMKSPEVGPLGLVAVVSVMLIDVGSLAVLVERHCWAMIAGAVMTGRAAIALCCTRGIPAARPDGLGAMVAGTVRPEVALSAFLFSAVAAHAGGDWRVVAVVGVAAAATALLIVRVRRRFGGVTGDVLGAACEIATAVTLLGLSAL